MQNEKIVPSEMVSLTAEYHLARKARGVRVIYITLIIAIMLMIALLPALNVDVTVKSPGILRPATEISVLRIPAQGIVQRVLVKENDTIRKGQLLLAIHSPVLAEKESFHTEKLKETNRFLLDLDQLTNPTLNIHQVTLDLTTSFYRQSLTDYRQKWMEKNIRLNKARSDHHRAEKLFRENVIARAEFENVLFELEKAAADLQLLKQTQLSIWHHDLVSYEKDADYYNDQIAQTQREKENLNLYAPVEGTIQNLAGIYPGSVVFANQEVAQLSPVTDLHAEVYVSPNDIGLLRQGMDVILQVSAYNYNEWGLAHGKILDIPNDIQWRDNEPVFEIKCALTTRELQLKSGLKGTLKKGMTLQARFVIANRTLWQLLYDKVDDWVNPNLR